MIVRDELSERAGDEKLQLISFFASQHVASLRARIDSGTESDPPDFFNDPRVHFMRNALAHVGSKQRQMVAAAIRTAFTQDTQEAARAEWRAVADRLRERFPKLGALMDETEDDVLAHLAFPKEHWPQLASTNPLERLNGEIKRRTDVVAIFPNEAAIVRLIGALLLEQNDEWAASRARYMSLEKLAQLSDDPQARPKRIAAV